MSGYPIPNEDEDRSQSQGEWASEDKWSRRFGLMIVVLSNLVLWSGIFVAVAWIF